MASEARALNPSGACIVCGGQAATSRHVESARIKSALSDYFTAPDAETLSIPSYDMVACTACGLEHASPMRSGDGAFYAWVTAQKGYYPRSRWEFAQVIDRIKQAAGKAPVRVLDVGCGGGDFLSLLHGAEGVDAVGLDTTPQSVERCRSRGLTAHCADIETFRAQNPDALFDFVCTFHCIEHVEDPVGLVASMVSVTRPGGLVVVSAPLSPMSFETQWFDPLNHPPHHLSRWTADALHALAGRLGLTLQLSASPAASPLGRAVAALRMRRFGPRHHPGRLRVLAEIARSPARLVSEYRRQAARPAIDGVPAGDTFLAFFRRPDDQTG